MRSRGLSHAPCSAITRRDATLAVHSVGLAPACLPACLAAVCHSAIAAIAALSRSSVGRYDSLSRTLYHKRGGAECPAAGLIFVVP